MPTNHLKVLSTSTQQKKLAIHQIFFREDQLPLLEPNFRPFDNSKSHQPKLMEYGVFLEAEKSQTLPTSVDDYVGFVSWKFHQKTNISGSKFQEFILNSERTDVYFINPFPHYLTFKNVWLQGEHFHPGIINFTSRVLKKIGYKIDLLELTNNSDTAAYCNYWVGNSAFWKEYLNFTKPLHEYLLYESTPDEREFLNSVGDKGTGHWYYPYILERMFSTLLVMRPDISKTSFQYQTADLKNKGVTKYTRLFLKGAASDNLLIQNLFLPAVRKAYSLARGLRNK
jgi:hypothetical protein